MSAAKLELVTTRENPSHSRPSTPSVKKPKARRARTTKSTDGGEQPKSIATKQETKSLAKKSKTSPKAKKRETLAQDIMNPKAVSCSMHSTLNDAARLMWENDLGALVVVDDCNRPLSMITDRDVAMAAYTQGQPLFHGVVSSAMSKTLAVARAETTVEELHQIMTTAGVRRLPVVAEDGSLCGVVGWTDLFAEACSPVPRERKRGSTPAMMVQLVSALLSAKADGS